MWSALAGQPRQWRCVRGPVLLYSWQDPQDVHCPFCPGGQSVHERIAHRVSRVCCTCKFESRASHIFANYYGSLLRSGPIKWVASRNALRNRGGRSYCEHAQAHAKDSAADVSGLAEPADSEEARQQASPRGAERVQMARAHGSQVRADLRAARSLMPGLPL